MNLPNFFLADLPPEAALTPAMVADSCESLRHNRERYLATRTTEQMIRWGVTADDLDDLSRKNLDEYAPELSVQVVESKEGGKAAILSEQDGYDAARLLLTSLHIRLAPQLGGDFFVATPARDMFIAMTSGPQPFLKRLRDRVQQDYRRLPYPISPGLFFVTRDGVAGTEGELGTAEAA